MAHFEKLLQGFCTMDYVWIKPQTGATMEQEGKFILDKIKRDEYIVALDEHGEGADSRRFAALLGRWRDSSKKPVFVIGGAYGLSGAVKQEADHMLSLAHQTYSHQIVRLMLMEQLYRGFCILSGHPYHK
jgi:23S rRNA (pseudouridine1915-N3)-methyltransferase